MIGARVRADRFSAIVHFRTLVGQNGDGTELNSKFSCLAERAAIFVSSFLANVADQRRSAMSSISRTLGFLAVSVFAAGALIAASHPVNSKPTSRTGDDPRTGVSIERIGL